MDSVTLCFWHSFYVGTKKIDVRLRGDRESMESFHIESPLSISLVSLSTLTKTCYDFPMLTNSYVTKI